MVKRPVSLLGFSKVSDQWKNNRNCIQKSKERKNLQDELIKQITKLEEQLALFATEAIKRELETKHNFGSIIEHKTNESKAIWVELGEKNTRYFLNLEKLDYNAKIITVLKREEGSEIKNPNDILNEEKNFYENLYSGNQPEVTDVELKDTNDFFLTQKKVLSQKAKYTHAKMK